MGEKRSLTAFPGAFSKMVVFERSRLQSLPHKAYSANVENHSVAPTRPYSRGNMAALERCTNSMTAMEKKSQWLVMAEFGPKISPKYACHINIVRQHCDS